MRLLRFLQPFFLLLLFVFPATAQTPTEIDPAWLLNTHDQTTAVRGGREVDRKAALYRPVVAIIRHFKIYNEKTKRYDRDGSKICSATVMNRLCLMLAAHCDAGPGEKNTSIDVYNGTSIEGRKPVARVEMDKTLIRKDNSMENDIAMMRLDRAAPIDQTYYTSNLHDANKTTKLAGTKVNIVGFGSVNSNYDPDTKKWTDVGVGEKREGDMEVVGNVDGKSPLIELKPTKGNHSAGRGDSGAPLLTEENGEATIWGVTGSVDDPVLTNVQSNYYTSVSHHLDWIKAATEELNCTESEAHTLSLQDLVHKEFSDYDKAGKQMKALTAGAVYDSLQETLKNAIAHSRTDAKRYKEIRIQSAVKDDKGELVINWEGIPPDDGNFPSDKDVSEKGQIIIPSQKLSRDRLTHPLLMVPTKPKTYANDPDE